MLHYHRSKYSVRAVIVNAEDPQLLDTILPRVDSELLYILQ